MLYAIFCYDSEAETCAWSKERRAMAAMMTMKKLDLAALQAAHDATPA